MKQKNDAAQWIERYIYDVVRRFPKNQQAEIEKEVRVLIYDLLEGKEETNVDAVKEVLMELGKPSLLADTYRGEKRYLIGPDYFDEYIMLLRLVIPIAVIVITAVMTIQYAVAPSGNPFVMVGEILGAILSAALQAFTWVTISMAAVSYYTVKTKKEEQWNLSDLPEVPKQTLRISKSDAIVSIVFHLITLVIVLSMLNYVGIYLFQDQLMYIALFPDEKLPLLQLLFGFVIALEIGGELLKLSAGSYSWKLAIPLTVLNTITLVISMVVIAMDQFWNPEFIQFIANITKDIITIQVRPVIAVIIILAYVIEQGFLFYKLANQK